MKKKLIFITWALEVGGAERLLVKLVQKIPLQKYDVKVVCITRKGVWAKEVEKSGIEVVSMNKKVGFDPTIFLRLPSYLKKDKPTLLISFARSGNSPESAKAVELVN